MNTYRADFLNITIDLSELSGLIARAANVNYALRPLAIKCTYPVFRGEASGSPAAFVKVGTKDEWLRTRRVLDEVGESGLFAKFLVSQPLDYRGFAVFVMEWREAVVVTPENMTRNQVVTFVKSCVEMSKALDRVTIAAELANLPIHPKRLYETLVGYAKRHPVVSHLLGSLLALPMDERTFRSSATAVVHGDFHSKNFGFDSSGAMGVCDFDKLMRGAPACGDLTNALVERFSCHHLSAGERKRLKAVTALAVSLSPWPRHDFVAVCNALRLLFAARRIDRHPNAPWVAFDIWRRDRKIREFLTCLNGDGLK